MDNDESKKRIEVLEARTKALEHLMCLQQTAMEVLSGRMEIARNCIETLQQADLVRNGGRKRPELN